MVLLGERNEGANPSLVRQHAEYRRIAHVALLYERGDLGSRALHLRMHATRADEQRATVFRQEHPAGTALEEFDTEVALELVDRSRHGGLRAEQCGASAIGAALIGNGKERSQMAELGLHFLKAGR
jgi:hypothetical protein